MNICEVSCMFANDAANNFLHYITQSISNKRKEYGCSLEKYTHTYMIYTYDITDCLIIHNIKQCFSNMHIYIQLNDMIINK